MTAKHNEFLSLFCLIFPLIILFGLIGSCNGLQCFSGPSDRWWLQGIETCEPEKTWCYNYTCENERAVGIMRGCIEKPMTKQEYLARFPWETDRECSEQQAPAKMIEILFCNTSLCNKAGNNKNAGPLGKMIVVFCQLLVALLLKVF